MNHLRQRDIEKLSAYLDQELSQREIQKLELRLQADPALRGALREFEENKKLLTRLPRVSPPHNFTLTRAMAGEIKSRSLYPFFRLASVVATVAFAILVGADAFLLDRAGEIRFAAPLAASGVSEEQEIEGQVFDESAAEELMTKADAVAEQPAELAVEEVEDRIFLTPPALPALESDLGSGASSDPLEPAATPCRECPTEMERAAAGPIGTAQGTQETTPEPQPTTTPSAPPPAADLELADETPIATVELPRATLISESEKPNMLLRTVEVTIGLAALLFAAIAFILRRAL